MQKICNYLSCHLSKTLRIHLSLHEDNRILLSLEAGEIPKEKPELSLELQRRIKISGDCVFSPLPCPKCCHVCVEKELRKEDNG